MENDGLMYVNADNLNEDSEPVETTSNTGTSDDSEQSNENSNNESKDSTPSLLDQLNELKEPEATEGGDLLGLIDKLGITRNGLPAQFENEDQIKEALSKGFDYTQKTQELATERQNFTEEMKKQQEAIAAQQKEIEEFRQQSSDELTDYKIIMKTVEQLKQLDPDTFELLDQAYTAQLTNYQNSIDNPFVNDLTKQLNELKGTVEGFSKQAVEKDNSRIRDEWESGIKEIQGKWGPKLKMLGIQANPEFWKAVEKDWSLDIEGKKSVEQALTSAHGPAIIEALNSHNKLLKTKQESQRRSDGVIDNGGNEEAGKPLSRLQRITQLWEKNAS